ncbi:MAG: TlpA disulfide reductase family protein [Bryobacter sp.]
MKRLLSSILLSRLLLASPPAKLSPVSEASYPQTVQAAKGNVVLVNFWATWCEPCRQEMPALAKMAKELGTKKFRLITVSADEPEDQKLAIDFLAKAGIQAPAYLKAAKDDEKFINSIDSKWSGALPALVLYDKTGAKSRVWIGESDLKQVRAAIDKLL